MNAGFRRSGRAKLAGIMLSGIAGSCAAEPCERTFPFTFIRNIPMFEATIGPSGPLLFMIDTGADPSAIDLETARRLGLYVDETRVGEASGAGDGEGLAIMPASIEGLTINCTRYPEIEALAVDLSPFSTALNAELAGVLGYSFLKGKVVRFDYPSGEIAIAERRDALPPLETDVAQSHEIPLRFNSEEDMIPVFDIVIDGAPATVSLDTGKSGGVEFFQSAVARLGFETLAAAGEEKKQLGARGETSVRKGELAAIELGPFRVENAPASFSDKTAPGQLREGNAGNSFLKNFVLTVDYVDGVIVFEQ